jgi:hypothetical protein
MVTSSKFPRFPLQQIERALHAETVPRVPGKVLVDLLADDDPVACAQ